MPVMPKPRKPSPPPDDGPRRPKRTGVPLHIYVPPELRAAMDALAERNRRLLTTEVIMALEAHLAAAGLWPPPSTSSTDAPSESG
jgi:hypothetical protein